MTRSYERLLRRVLNLNHQPAVIILNAWAPEEGTDVYYKGNADRNIMELSTYYDVATLSLKACCYHLMQSGVKGFRIDKMIAHLPNNDTSVAEQEIRNKEYFFIDSYGHAYGETGNR
jgi:hypothetical protein